MLNVEKQLKVTDDVEMNGVSMEIPIANMRLMITFKTDNEKFQEIEINKSVWN